MMGQLKHEQEQLFYEFRLDEVVPGDHLVREIAAVLDLTWVRAELASYSSIAQGPMTVALARSSPNAAQRRQSVRSHAASTRALAMPPAHSLTRKPSSNRVATENASRCYSHTLSAS